MMGQLIITAVGPDRPGLVGELTGHLHAAGANLLDTRMVNLRGQFALMILLEAAADPLIHLAQELPAVAKRMGLHLSIADQSTALPHATGLRYQLKTYSMDQPGIVAKLSNVLREHQVNIEELSAWQESAAFAGGPLFLTEMHLTVPANVPISQLRSALTTLCNQLNCDIDLEPEKS